MRLYHIVSGILLIPLTIDFAVTAPVLIQGQRQTRVDVKHITEDMMNWERRGVLKTSS